MVNMLKMMKQVRQVRKMQKQLASKTVEIRSTDGTVVVTARGDMTIKSITIDPRAMDPSRPEHLAKLIASTVNGALDSAKKASAKDMAALSEDMGLGGMFGG